MLCFTPSKKHMLGPSTMGKGMEIVLLLEKIEIRSSSSLIDFTQLKLTYINFKQKLYLMP